LFTKPKHKIPNILDNQVLTNSPETDLASYLALVVERYPELVELVRAWPSLSAEVRKIILKIV